MNKAKLYKKKTANTNIKFRQFYFSSYNNKIGYKNYLLKDKHFKEKIYISLIRAIQPDSTIIQIKQIEATVDKANWFSADYAIEHVLFQLYSLMNHNQKNLKQLAHEYKTYESYNNDIYLYSKYLAKYPNGNGFSKSLLTNPLILDFLWNNSYARNLVLNIFDGFISIKNRFGVELQSSRNCSFHQEQLAFHLLRGYTSNGYIILPSYHRMNKIKLSKSEWITAMKAYSDIFTNLWD